MSEKKRNVTLTPDTICECLVSDPCDLPDCRIVFGFLGKSTTKDRWRMYSGLELDDYIEFDEVDVLHSESLASDSNPVGGTILWIGKDTVIHHTRSEARELAESSFLQGSITNEFLKDTGVNSLTTGAGSYGIWTIVTSIPCAIGATIALTVTVCTGPKGPGKNKLL